MAMTKTTACLTLPYQPEKGSGRSGKRAWTEGKLRGTNAAYQMPATQPTRLTRVIGGMRGEATGKVARGRMMAYAAMTGSMAEEGQTEVVGRVHRSTGLGGGAAALWSMMKITGEAEEGG